MKLLSYCFFVLIVSSIVHAQEQTALNTKFLDSLMLEKQIAKAELQLNSQLDYIEFHELHDSLHKYVYYVGKIELLKSDVQTASKKADDFLNYITLKTNSKRTFYQALLELADFYDDIGNNHKSLELAQRALEAVKKVPDATPEEIGKVEYNIGATFLSLGNLNEGKTYFQKALKRFENYNSTSKPQLSDGYNAVGATMWMSSKLDSAKYYYAKAVKTIESAENDPVMNLYLGTVIKSNISLLEYTQGNLDEAINIQNNVILNYEKTIKNHKDENVVSKAKRFQLRAISNMAVFYNEQGNLEKAHDLMLFSYEKKKKIRESNDSDLGSTLIQLGQSKLSLQDYDEAIVYLQKGIAHFEQYEIKNPYWQAAGLHAMAEAYTAKKNSELAKTYYEQSEELFKEALGNEYDMEFLGFLRNKSLFMAENNEPEKALETAKNAYDYVVNNGGADNFSLLKQYINLAQVNYKTGNYKHSLEWIDKANQYLNNPTSTADAKQIAFNKPALILLKSLGDYALEPNKNANFLKQLLNDLDKATTILEERKTTVFKNDDVKILMADYHEISNFSKKIALELYQITDNPNALDKLIELHESAIYNRIRSRLNLKNNIAFTDIPKAVLEREVALKKDMSASLNATEGIQEFISTNDNWTTFLDSLKTNYPKYYKMRYATIQEPLQNLQSRIPENTTLIRYVYIDDFLYAFVISKNKKNLIKLSTENLKEQLLKLNEYTFEVEEISPNLISLYNQLWKPFETMVTTKNVVIIPDRELFNLSFEMLTPKSITSFSDLAINSLLSKHIISYNYSLLLIEKSNQTIGYTDNFVAFAPEFNDQMKSDYQISIKDSLSIDRFYLTLLPQPFTKDLATKSTSLFKGQSFLNANSTREIFKNSAKEHKIIHIGTHAESNNMSPELSRLIFAKSIDSTNTDDNYLYTYEIYNINLSSNLAILTACETGKPTYQAGEGMISLAHAFNYAGSESIITSLWKIDEQSSAEIIALFYNKIKKGFPKDEALQQAKLDYIKHAKGRTINPQYWAGLILIGDTAPIKLSTNSNFIFWIIAVVVLILLVLFIRKQRKK